MKKMKFSFSAIAFMLAIFAVFAFKTPAVKVNSTNTTYHYKGTTNTFPQLNDPSNWEQITPSCSGGTIPCSASYNGDYTAFSNFLTSATVAQIDAVVVLRKP